MIDRPSRTDEQANMLAHRLRKNARHRGKWARRQNLGAYRLYDRDIPEIPIVVDWYEGHLHIADRSRFDVTDDAAWEAREERLLHFANAASLELKVEPEQVYIKQRLRQKGSAQYTRLDETGHRLWVREGEHRFLVNLADFLDTGLFLDHRPARGWVKAEAHGRRFLNLFAYTGAFSVYAAAGGAVSTTTVDLSNTYLEWARENLKENGLFGPRHELVRADARRFLEGRGLTERYDLVVVDPPTFSNSKRMEGSFDVVRDHVDLLYAVYECTAPGGIVYFSTNASRFRLMVEDLPFSQIEDVTPQSIPLDFEAHRPHRCYRLVKQ